MDKRMNNQCEIIDVDNIDRGFRYLKFLTSFCTQRRSNSPVSGSIYGELVISLSRSEQDNPCFLATSDLEKWRGSTFTVFIKQNICYLVLDTERWGHHPSPMHLSYYSCEHEQGQSFWTFCVPDNWSQLIRVACHNKVTTIRVEDSTQCYDSLWFRSLTSLVNKHILGIHVSCLLLLFSLLLLSWLAVSS